MDERLIALLTGMFLVSGAMGIAVLLKTIRAIQSGQDLARAQMGFFKTDVAGSVHTIAELLKRVTILEKKLAHARIFEVKNGNVKTGVYSHTDATEAAAETAADMNQPTEVHARPPKKSIEIIEEQEIGGIDALEPISAEEMNGRITS